MVRPPKSKQTPNMQAAIREAAWKQIAQAGAPALSLRAIARALKITAPAIYNYFGDRDALVTALIIEAYNSFADWQIDARDALPPDDLDGRLRATGHAYRAWALAYPERYQLVFGTPIPGYHAPLEECMPAAARAFGVIVSVTQALRAAGRLRTDGLPTAPANDPAFNAWLAYGAPQGTPPAPVSAVAATLIWARVHGLVSLEIGGNLASFGPGAEALYAHEIESIIHQFCAPPKRRRKLAQ